MWKELCSDSNNTMSVISIYFFTWNDWVSLALGTTLFSIVVVSSLWSMLLAAVCKGKKSSQWNLSHHIPIFWSVQSISKYWFTWTNGVSVRPANCARSSSLNACSFLFSSSPCLWGCTHKGLLYGVCLISNITRIKYQRDSKKRLSLLAQEICFFNLPQSARYKSK